MRLLFGLVLLQVEDKEVLSKGCDLGIVCASCCTRVGGVDGSPRIKCTSTIFLQAKRKD
jgi:hypothetical protein